MRVVGPFFLTAAEWRVYGSVSDSGRDARAPRQQAAAVPQLCSRRKNLAQCALQRAATILQAELGEFKPPRSLGTRALRPACGRDARAPRLQRSFERGLGFLHVGGWFAHWGLRAYNGAP